MRLISKFLFDPIYWRVSSADSKVFEINDNYSLINPLYYPSIDEKLLEDISKMHRLISEEEYLLYSHSIVFQVSKDIDFDDALDQTDEISKNLISNSFTNCGFKTLCSIERSSIISTGTRSECRSNK